MDGAEIRELEPKTVWRRVHRPEEYAADAAKFVAGELHVPFLVVRPFVPLARALLSKWEDAAVETTALYETPEGGRVLRTFFEITDYSGAAVYNFLEKLLKSLGVGADLAGKYGDTDFAWVLLGGVLDDYARRARVCRKTACALIDFRFPLSDYHTATTWYPDRVEIANLRTGRVETLEIRPGEIKRIVDFTINFENNPLCARPAAVAPGSPEYCEFERLAGIYDEILSAKKF